MSSEIRDEYGVGTFILALAFGLICRTYLAHAIHLPYTVILLLLGLLVGAIHFEVTDNEAEESGSWIQHLGNSLVYWIHMPPEVLLYTFLPVLIFESAFSTDVHIFQRELSQVMMLAVVGVIISTILTALVAKYVFPYGWGWNLSIVFGAMMSATDPVAVVALLKELGVSERLGTLIEGESLLNDGTAYVIFLVFLNGLINDDEKVSPDEVLKLGAQLALGGPCIGAIIGWAGSFLVGYILNDPLSEITMTVVVCYSTFLVSENKLHVSGILAVVTAGLFFSHLGRGRISSPVEHTLHSFWSVLGYVANTVIFFVSGLIVADGIYSGLIQPSDWGWLVILYILLLLIRAVNVLCCSPVLVKGKYGVDLRQMIVISWGGLRGAVGLILALVMVEEAHLVDDSDHSRRWLETTHNSISDHSTTSSHTSYGEESLAEQAERVLFFMAGIALLTLIVNGSTTGQLLHLLHLDRSSKAETELFVRACSALEAKMEHIVQVLKGDRMVGDADFKTVWRYIPLLTAKTYWHRIRAGNIELCEEEMADIRSNWTKSSYWHRVMRWTLHKFCEPFVARHYSNIPPRMRSTWKKYHKAFRLDEHDVDRIVETNKIHANLGNLGQGLVHHSRIASKDEASVAKDSIARAPEVLGSSLKRHESLWLQGPHGADEDTDEGDEPGTRVLHSTLDLAGMNTPSPVPSKHQSPGLNHMPETHSPSLHGNPKPDLKPVLKKNIVDGDTVEAPNLLKTFFQPKQNKVDSIDFEETKDTLVDGGEKRSVSPPGAVRFIDLDTEEKLSDRFAKNLTDEALLKEKNEKEEEIRGKEEIQKKRMNKKATFLEKYKLKKKLIKELQQVEEELLVAQGQVLTAFEAEDEDEIVENQQTTQLINNMTLTNHKTIRQKIQNMEVYTKSQHKHFNNTMHEARVRLLQGYKSQFEDRFRRGWLTPTGLRIFLDTVDNQIDCCDAPLCLWEEVSKSVTVSNKALMVAADLRTVWLLGHVVTGVMAQRLGHLFELASNFIKASEDIDVLEIVEAGPLANELALETLYQVKKARIALRTHLPVFAEIARAMKTKVAARYLLIKQHELVEDFYHSGHINEKEQELLLHEIDRSRRKLNYHPLSENLPPRIKLIGHLPFLRKMDKDEKEHFLNDSHFVEEEFHSTGSVLIKEGMQDALQGRELTFSNQDVSGLKAGFYVVVRGSVKQTIYRNGTGEQHRVLHAGTLFGLDDQLLGIPYKATYTTASFCHCFFFNSRSIFAEATRSHHLNEGIWFTLAVSVVRHLRHFSHLNIKEVYEIMQEAKFHELNHDPEASIMSNSNTTSAGEGRSKRSTKSSSSNKGSLDDTPKSSTKRSKLSEFRHKHTPKGIDRSMHTLAQLGGRILKQASKANVHLADSGDPVDFDMEPGSQILLLKGRMLPRTTLEGATVAPSPGRKAVAIIKDIDGNVLFEEGSIIFELGPTVLQRLSTAPIKMHRSMHKKMDIEQDYHQVKSTSLIQGKQLGRASELRQDVSLPNKDHFRANRMKRDLSMARKALESAITPRASEGKEMEPFPVDDDDGDDFLMQVELGGRPGRSSRVYTGTHDSISMRSRVGTYQSGSIRSRAGTFDVFGWVKGNKSRSNTEVAAELGLVNVAKGILNQSSESLASSVANSPPLGSVPVRPRKGSRTSAILDPKEIGRRVTAAFSSNSRPREDSGAKSNVENIEELYEAKDQGGDEAYNLGIDDSTARKPILLAEQSVKIDGLDVDKSASLTLDSVDQSFDDKFDKK